MIKSIIIPHKNVGSSVLTVLQHYSLFKYPLKADEIFCNMPAGCRLSSLLVALEDMDNAGYIYKYAGYYCLDPEVKTWVLLRKRAKMN